MEILQVKVVNGKLVYLVTGCFGGINQRPVMYFENSLFFLLDINIS